MRASLRPAILAGVGVVAVVAATAITLSVSASSGGSDGKAHGGSTASQTSVSVCEQLAVPAYFSTAYWKAAIRSTPPPADIILNPATGVGAGNSPNRQLQALVKQAQAEGITVLGYSSTVNGQRPASEVEADVQHYAAWYGVHSIFLDRVSGQAAQLSYYKQLAAYIHGAYRGAQVWLNPGDYPDRSYMSVGDVVLVFEGSYANYVTSPVPSWVKYYPAAKFAQTIFATPKDVLLQALEMTKQRRAGHIYVTDLVGSNPYQGLPSFWATEDAEATASCAGSG